MSLIMIIKLLKSVGQFCILYLQICPGKFTIAIVN